jgi:signal transduction histidine kinase
MAAMDESKQDNGLGVLTKSEGYFVALAGVIVCTLARYPLQSVLDTRAPYAFYLPVVAFCAWRYGLRVAVACFSMGASLGTYLYVRPVYAITNKPEALGLIFFILSSTVVAMIGGANKKAQDQLELAQEALHRANQELEIRVEERTAALVEKNEELSSFTYTVAHDLRSAIRSMVVNARVLLEDEGEKLGPSGCDQTQRLYGSAIRLSNFVDDLLQYARTGNRPVVTQPINLSQIFERQADVVGADDDVAKFQATSESDLYVQGDPTLLALVMHNLVENSCKYRSSERELLIEFGSCQINGEEWFYVRDNGIGFDAAFSDKIFKPFERLHRYADIPGTGIGLSNVKRIIERHGGRIWAESEGSESGAAFYFTLQRVPAPIEHCDYVSLATAA